MAKKRKNRGGARGGAAERQNSNSETKGATAAAAKSTIKDEIDLPVEGAELPGEFAKLTPQQRLRQLSYVLMIIAAIFLVNSLEPDSKGDTGGIGAVATVLGIGFFVYSRFVKKG